MDGSKSFEARMIAQIAELAGVEPDRLSPDTSLSEIGIDSVLLALVLRSIEEGFVIELKDEEVASFLSAATVGDYIATLNDAIRRRSNTGDAITD